MENTHSLVVEVQMLIRRPVAEVFEAFVNPEITTKFWFTKSSGRLEIGKIVRWDWEMYGVGDDVTVKEFEINKRLVIQWHSDSTYVEWNFEPRGDGATFVKVSNWGFTGENLVAQALDAKGGYSFVLSGLKAWLEHRVELNLVLDHFPDGCPV